MTEINKVWGCAVYIVDDIIILSILCLYDMLCLILSFRFPPDFWWKDFVAIFLQCIPCRCKVKKLKVDLYQIIDIYPWIIFMNKGMIIVQKLHVQCDSLKVFSTVLAAINTVFMRIVYIVHSIIILFCQLMYALLWAMSSFRSPPRFLKEGFHSNYLLDFSLHVGVW